jgi:hypothetical protein
MKYSSYEYIKNEKTASKICRNSLSAAAFRQRENTHKGLAHSFN